MLRLLTLILFLALAPAAAEARVLVHIKISEQRLHLYVNGALHNTWPVSTGLRHGWTPTGVYRPYFLSRHHRSSLFRGAPMPYSVFYDRDWAIHGTNQIKRLGSPASRGCVRLHPDNAAVFFSLVLKYGKANTLIWISD